MAARVQAAVEVVKNKALKVAEDTKAYAKEKTSQAMEMSNAAKQRVVTMAQQRMLAVAASKEAMRGYLQNGQVLLLDAYKEFRATGVKEFSQKYAALLKQHTGEHALLLKQLAIKQSQQVKASSLAVVGSVQRRVTTTYETCHSKAQQAVTSAKAKTVEISTKAKNVAKDGHVQATAAGVCGGAVALGATGGATGLTAGVVVGAALGVVPAIFTFGLSIPLGAVIGGGTGLAVGTTVGATAGAVSGGAASYGAYARKDEINEMRTRAVSRVSSGVDLVRGKAVASVDYVKSQATLVRARFAKA